MGLFAGACRHPGDDAAPALLNACSQPLGNAASSKRKVLEPDRGGVGKRAITITMMPSSVRCPHHAAGRAGA